MSKKRLIIVGAIILTLIVAYALLGNENDENAPVTTKVTKGNFLNEVIISGEAQSTSSKKIMGPAGARRYRIYQLKVQDLVPEGTIVKKGDYIGKLDPSEINAKILDAQLNLEKAQSKYTQEQLDTTLTLKQERNKIKDLQFKIEEDSLELERSIYEPPATIRSLQIGIEKTQRDLREKKADYYIRKKQANAKMIEVGTEVSKIKKEIESLAELQGQFTIRSHDDGMVTYIKDWGGNKIKVGANISTWDPAVASLPDLTKMESKTYSNEVDIRKIKKGLKVKVGFDAFPKIQLDGVVTGVANVGENKKGSDIKLFQVLIKLNDTDSNIRPGMTTSNRIITHEIEDVLIVPLEAVFSKDSISFAYLKSGYSIAKKEIKLGISNNNSVIIEEGLNEGDIVYLNKPEGLEEKDITPLK
ncbi:efflux RND transporter periplasmic adaptor subunit [Hyunsoonleella pacifica]|uniref:HlyD family efflux transporter periplasmic adaptor subunit n=1 Tax=Hyunsoonleella pacifica TaxID=1080224 RepID=A0A4Q9FQ69_9FLAO|nr:HlyD family secretion protein [Hyunsoonleella pacifica]TBN17393.1 HlyD family efflux transporter periplasmic adaptor subunit [Hyunsoonleella pacifica]GGD12347.1 RND transporter [Hyunsoonleella pacifica]